MTNCRSSLRRKRARPMARYDALPTDLRLWLQQAALPWNIASAERIWHKRLRQNGGDRVEALNWLTQVERATIAKDSTRSCA